MQDTHPTQDRKIPKKGKIEIMKLSAIWVMPLCVLSLFIAAWHYGIFASAALILKDVAVALWKMMCDAAATFRDFGRYIISQRQ